MIVIKDKDPGTFIVGLFFDSWILMLCLGALGHIFAVPILFLSMKKQQIKDLENREPYIPRKKD